MQRKEDKTGLEWVGKVIHRELCTKLEFNPIKMDKPEFFQ